MQHKMLEDDIDKLIKYISPALDININILQNCSSAESPQHCLAVKMKNKGISVSFVIKLFFHGSWSLLVFKIF